MNQLSVIILVFNMKLGVLKSDIIIIMPARIWKTVEVA